MEVITMYPLQRTSPLGLPTTPAEAAEAAAEEAAEAAAEAEAAEAAEAVLLNPLWSLPC